MRNDKRNRQHVINALFGLIFSVGVVACGTSCPTDQVAKPTPVLFSYIIEGMVRVPPKGDGTPDCDRLTLRNSQTGEVSMRCVDWPTWTHSRVGAIYRSDY